MSDDLWVAGLNHGAHDSSAVLLCNGDLVAAIEQERFSRRKRAVDQPPVEALKWCLDHADIALQDVAAIGLGSDLDALGTWMGLTTAQRRAQLPLDDPERLLPLSVFGDGSRPPLMPVRHHLAHAASAFWPSGYNEAAILVVDNRGEDSSTTLAHGTADGIEVLQTYPVEHSLGLYYRIATQYAGLYSKDGNAGKLMGLAAYGKPIYDTALCHTINGPEWIGVPAPAANGQDLPPERTAQLLAFLTRTCFPYTVGLTEEITAYTNFAASVQHALEETVLALAEDVHRRTGSRNIVLAGGVALNCTANGRLAAEGPYENLYVQPMAHDAGAALGAALEVTRRLDLTRFHQKPMTHALWGPSYQDDQIEAALRRHSLTGEHFLPDALVRHTAAILSQGGIVGWHQGRSEAGPRALGARSLLGDPRTRSTLVRLNRIKQREMWRPLAPSVLAERYDKYFIGRPNPFMIMAAVVRPEMQATIPAVVHIDGSARPQAVEPADLPLFASLLEAFEVETGLPMVVNTSFNTAGEPLVNSPDEAIVTFLNTDIDALAIGRFLVGRS